MRIVLYADVNLNIIDGSSIWLASIAEVASKFAGEVHVLLKMRITDDRLVRAVTDIPNVHLVSTSAVTSGKRLTPELAATELERLAKELNPGAIIVRGINACEAAASRESLRPILWNYVTELAFPLQNLDDEAVARLDHIASGSRRMFAQTESARSYLEAVSGAAAGKTLLLPPMIPDDYFQSNVVQPVGPNLGSAERPLRLVYSGKLASNWRVMEMLDLPDELAKRGIESELWIVGDKYQRNPDDETWMPRLEAKLQAIKDGANPRVTWFGGMSRDEAVDRVREADLGIGWRSKSLDSSLELSTKALEYSAAGVPPLLNRSEDHESVWGADYPLFIDEDSLEAVAIRIATSINVLPEASVTAKRSVDYYSMSNAAKRLENYLSRAFVGAATPVEARTQKTKVLVASHNFKFMGELMDYLRSNSEFDLRIDQWKGGGKHDEAESKSLLNWADVVLCEWADQNAVWYSQHKRPGQRLIVRMHRYELWAPWVHDIQFENVDTLILVSEYFRDKALAMLNVQPDSTAVISNTVDYLDMNRPKIPGSEFHLGMMGIVSFGKRPDRGLDLLEKLLSVDDRYYLHIKGRMPWEYAYEWKNPIQRELYMRFFERIRSSEMLRNHVAFEGFGADVASWLRKIGVMLSPSTGQYESFHLAPAEGLASGSSAVLWPREGAVELFGEERVYENLDDARDYVLSLRNPSVRGSEAEKSRAWAERWDIQNVMDQWRLVLLGVEGETDAR